MRPFEWSPATVMALGIEMQLSQLVITRESFKVMDIMSDIGGFAVVLALLGFLTFKIFD